MRHDDEDSEKEEQRLLQMTGLVIWIVQRADETKTIGPAVLQSFRTHWEECHTHDERDAQQISF